MRDKIAQPILELVALDGREGLTLVGDRDGQARGEERGLPHAGRDDREAEVYALEDLLVGPERDGGAVAPGPPDTLHRTGRVATPGGPTVAVAGGGPGDPVPSAWSRRPPVGPAGGGTGRAPLRPRAGSTGRSPPTHRRREARRR